MSQRLNAVIPLIMIAFILTGAFSSCKDDPVTPPGNGCDTCVCDTCDTTDTVIVTPSDTTSHDFSWTEYNIPSEASITGCWVFDDTTIWAVSNELYKWTPEGFQQIHHFASGTSIFAFTLGDAWFIYSTILWHKVGEEYKQIRLNQAPYNISLDGAFRAAWGTSSNDIFFVGDKGTIVHFDGTNWMKFPKVTEKNLVSVWGTSPTNVWASGWSSSTALSVLLHYDGTNWTEVDVSKIGWIGASKHALITVWSTDSAGHQVTYTGGSLVWKRTDDGPWRQDSAELGNRLGDGGFAGIGLRGNNANDVLAAGPYGYVSHWNGKSWHRFGEFWSPGNPFFAVQAMAMKGNTICVAGANGGSWIAIGRRVK